MVSTRTWPFGTTKAVEVLGVVNTPSALAIVCVEEAQRDEAFLCIFRPDQVEATEGNRGVITFTPGGPTGGYWRFSKTS